MVRIRWVLLLLVSLVAGIACAADTDEAIVRKIVAEQLKVDVSAVGVDTPLSDVGQGADALDVVEISWPSTRSCGWTSRTQTSKR